jgi:4-amino-4-deoxy-L-arabinose transferase-like glycosyltransferase
MAPQKKTSITVILLMLTGALFFLPFLGSFPLMDWDEANFAEIAREMIETGDYLNMHINYIAFTEKPPMFFWMQVISMKVFGINEFAARFPNAFTGIITLPVLYLMGKRLIDRSFGLIWALAYFGSILPHFYFKSGIIDPVFNFFIFLSIYYLYKYFSIIIAKDVGNKKSKWLNLTIAGLFCGLAILTKGPVALLIIGLLGFVVFVKHRFRHFHIFELLYYLLITIGIVSIWLGFASYKYGPGFISDFIQRQIELFSTPDAGHAGFPGYHVVVLLIGCFPVSIFAIKSIFRIRQKELYQAEWQFWMIALFWIVLILFTIVRSKIIHYSSLAYFPITFLGAVTIMKIINNKNGFDKWILIVLTAINLFLAALIILLFFIGSNPLSIEPWVSDPDLIHTLSTLSVDWPVWTLIPAMVSALSIIFFCIFTKKTKVLLAIRVLFYANAFWVASIIIFILPNILTYTQGPSTSFYKEKAYENCYVSTYKFKSYIPYFYTKKKENEVLTVAYLQYLRTEKDIDDLMNLKQNEHQSYFNEFLLNGKIEKPAYFVTRVKFVTELESAFPALMKLKSEGGYAYFVRHPNLK